MITYVIKLCFFTYFYIVSRCSALPSLGVGLIVAHLHGAAVLDHICQTALAIGQFSAEISVWITHL